MKYYKIDIMNTGAEYTYGVVEEKEEVALLRAKAEEAIENGRNLSSYDIENEDLDLQIEPFNYTQLTTAYGPCIDQETQVNIQQVTSNDFYELEYLGEEVDFTVTNLFTVDNPYISEEFLEKFNKDSLLWGVQKIEKRIHFPVMLELEDNAEFLKDNLYFGSINMDEIFSNDEILHSVLYILDSDKKDIIKELIKEKVLDGDESIEEYVTNFDDILAECYKDHQTFFLDYVLEEGDIEGKGEYENDKSIIMDMDQNIVYQGEDY